jgi:hypothetical protein
VHRGGALFGPRLKQQTASSDGAKAAPLLVQAADWEDKNVVFNTLTRSASGEAMPRQARAIRIAPLCMENMCRSRGSASSPYLVQREGQLRRFTLYGLRPSCRRARAPTTRLAILIQKRYRCRPMLAIYTARA